ncbi:MAG: class I SAM-dependent methyltransferase [Phormidesmis sp.]
MKVLHHYNDDHNTTSALEIVPYIFDILPVKPESVVDIGCGLAQWLKVFKDYGVQEILGVDGFHVPSDKIQIDLNEFIKCDLRYLSFSEIGKRFDLLLCLEVAEHLEPEYAERFVENLVLLSDHIVFSAAVPNQTGENHVNEQYAHYWVEIFARYNYCFLDPFREKLWAMDSVNWWYKQNMFLVVKEELANSYDFPYNGNIYIHPKLLELQVLSAKSLASIVADRPHVSGVKASFRHLLREVLKKIL